MFMLWLGWALFNTGMPAQVRTVILALLFRSRWRGVLLSTAPTAVFPHAPFHDLNVRLSEGASGGTRIVHSNKLTMLPAVYYDRGLNQGSPRDPPGSGSDTLALPTQDVLGLWAEETPAEAAGGADKVWFVIFSRAETEYPSTWVTTSTPTLPGYRPITASMASKPGVMCWSIGLNPKR